MPTVRDGQAGCSVVVRRAKDGKRDVHGILLLDKPEGMTSNAALQRVKRIYRAQKAGHTGSLDPIATGLLPVCFGRATRVTGFLLDSDKRYRGVARLGLQTETGDREGAVVSCSNPEELDIADLEAAIPRLLGMQRQLPPMHSALKRDGVPLYALARRGMQVPRDHRIIHIFELKVVSYRNHLLEFEVLCSKGTYVRTLVEDWASAVGQCAHLTALRRLEVGIFSEHNLVSMETLDQMESLAGMDQLLLPISSAFQGWRRIVVGDENKKRLAFGQAVYLGGKITAGRLVVFDAAGNLLGIAQGEPQGILRPKRWLTPLNTR